jgi:hypothetical protein
VRHRHVRWASAVLLALYGCASQGDTLGEGQGSTVQISAACPPAGVEPLSGTILSVAPSERESEGVYCGRGNIHLLASPWLPNDCAPDGFPCPFNGEGLSQP